MEESLQNMSYPLQHVEKTMSDLLRQVRSQLAQKKLRDAKQRIAKLRLLRSSAVSQTGLRIGMAPPKNKLPPAPLMRRRVVANDAAASATTIHESQSRAAREATRLAKKALENAPPAPPR